MIGSAGGAAHQLLEFKGYEEEMSVILRHIKNDSGKDLSKQNSRSNIFLMEQRKTESINQFAGRVEQ